jgi:murein DD-endopeptidase MepM/ murein hydrolase activator NlpD
MRNLALIVCLVWLAGCRGPYLEIETATPLPTAPRAVSIDQTATQSPATATPFSTSTAPPVPLPLSNLTPTALPTKALPATPLLPTLTYKDSQLCSPLQDITISELKDIVTTPFQAPPAGKDDGHHGIDFAYWRRGTHTSMSGLPVYSMLTGRIAAVVLDRYPYGNMVIVETTLAGLSSELSSLLPSTRQPTPIPGNIRLSCPQLDPMPNWDLNTPSLYVLYAHMNQAPLVNLGAEVTCGQPLGEVGTTGGSVNPHLHLETRLGPAGATFASLSHYRNDASEQEKASYCSWRVSGLFQPFDPMLLINP